MSSQIAITNGGAYSNSSDFNDFMSTHYGIKHNGSLNVEPDSTITVGGKIITSKQLEMYIKVLDKIISEHYPEELL